MRETTRSPPPPPPDRSSGREPGRFDRNALLLGREAVERLARARVAVFGLGGVGSWAAEALARAGVGALDLVDFDRVSLTNVNRQLPALQVTVGRPKAEVVAERLRLINPQARVVAREAFYGAETAEELLPAEGVAFVVDAIDNVKAKLHLLARCVRLGIPVVSSMGAAGRLDPTAIRVGDLSETHTDMFAKDVRKYLRVKHGIDCARPTGVIAVWSVERCREPEVLDGAVAEPARVGPRGHPGPRCRDRPRPVNGTAAFVTGAFGMVAASVVVRALAARG